MLLSWDLATIWSFWVVAILKTECRWKLSFQPGLSQPVSPTTVNSYRSITFGLFRHRQSLFFQLCWVCCYRRLCWCHSWGGGLFPETDLSIVSAQRQRRKNSVTAYGNYFVIIKTFQTKFRFYTWWQTGATCPPFRQPFPQWDFPMLEKSINWIIHNLIVCAKDIHILQEVNSNSLLTAAMDVARGGKFTSIPANYPASAW